MYGFMRGHYWREEDEVVETLVKFPGKKAGLPLGPHAPHYPNKFERKELARIAKKSGLSEEEIRANKVNRIALSKAAKSDYGDGSGKIKLKLRRLKNEVALELGTHINDPKVMGIALKRLRK